ncbi:MAG: hypothetical protein MZU84_00625 [Sphingobacterium sp.]|nr:hypothetical protein [Sphingobacterium sp.]
MTSLLLRIDPVGQIAVLRLQPACPGDGSTLYHRRIIVEEQVMQNMLNQLPAEVAGGIPRQLTGEIVY